MIMMVPAMSVPPIFYHIFRHPLPYARTLALQEHLHQLQLSARRTDSARHRDLLLLLEHRPVYTAGRRQSESSLEQDRTRLTGLGADFVTTSRGGQLTYHGPGQIVGYPLLDLGRAGTSPTSIREYICRLQKTLEDYLHTAHGISHIPSEHTGVFLDRTTKIASIGVQVRHRLTTHGFALNVTRQPLSWFGQVVACGLDDVRAGCVEEASGGDKVLQMADEMGLVVNAFGRIFGREMVKLSAEEDISVFNAISALETDAERMGECTVAPPHTSRR